VTPVVIPRWKIMSTGILNALFCWDDILISLLVTQSPTVHRRAVASALAAPVGRTS
jgi:ABC-type glycerol-3-phosphate transport system permease component